MFYLTNNYYIKITYPDKKIKYEKIAFCLANANYNSLLNISEILLTNIEKKIFINYKFEKKKKNYLLSRFAAKKAINSYYSCTKKIKNNSIINGVLGEPIINKNNNITLSHTGDWGIAIMSPLSLPFGIDIEQISIDNINNIDFNYNVIATNEELEILFSSIKLKHDYIYKYLLWTAKESLVKLLKIGFTVPLDILAIDSIKFYKNNIIIGSFKNFYAYNFIIFLGKNLIIAMTCYKYIAYKSLMKNFSIINKYA